MSEFRRDDSHQRAARESAERWRYEQEEAQREQDQAMDEQAKQRREEAEETLESTDDVIRDIDDILDGIEAEGILGTELEELLNYRQKGGQ